MNPDAVQRKIYWVIIVVVVTISMAIVTYYYLKINDIDRKLQKMHVGVAVRGIVLFLVSMMILFPVRLHAQDISAIGKGDPLKVSGNLSAGIRLYEANGIENRNDPFVWTTSGAFNFDFYGVNMPFTFMFSSQNQNFRQPFNRFGVSPHYKWLRLHLGYRNLDLSPYTLSGNTFLGAGVELTPGRFNITALYGRLRKEVEEDTLSSISLIPSYRRTGYGLKVGYGEVENHIDLILFKAQDDPNSIQEPVKSSIRAEDNLAFSVIGTKRIFEKLSLKAEYAASALNRDVRSEQIELESRKVYNSLGGFFKPTSSVQFSEAVDAAIFYKVSSAIDFDITYQRVDPGYRTLGTYFFNNDREQLSLNTSIRAIDNKLNVRAGYGTQRNNLASTETTTLSRKAGNASISYSISQMLNISVNYSNFSSAINFIEDPLNPRRNPEDTLNIIQTSHNAGFLMNYMIRRETKTHSFILNGNYQGQRPKSGTEDRLNMASGMYNGNLMYRLNFIPVKMNASLSVNYNRNDFSGLLTSRVGPVVQVSRMLLKNRLRLNISAAGYRAYRESELLNITYNLRFTTDWRITSHHGLNAGFNMISRVNESVKSIAPSFTEYISTMSYNYRF